MTKQQRRLKVAVGTTKVAQGLPPDGKPVFLLCRPKERADAIKAHMESLIADSSIRRQIYWLKPGDLAATVRAWLLEQEPTGQGVKKG